MSIQFKPEDGSIGVLEDQTITWDAAPGYVAGYVVSIGTTVSGGELFDNFDVGNVLFFDLPTLDFSTTYYVSVTAYNALGEGQDCSESSRASFTVRDIPVPDNKDVQMLKKLDVVQYLMLTQLTLLILEHQIIAVCLQMVIQVYGILYLEMVAM